MRFTTTRSTNPNRQNCPQPDERSDRQVVGGSDKGGILVRKGQDLKSEQCADRGSAWLDGKMGKMDKKNTYSVDMYNYVCIMYIHRTS